MQRSWLDHIEDEKLRTIFERGHSLSWTILDLDYAFRVTYDCLAKDSMEGEVSLEVMAIRWERMREAKALMAKGRNMEAMRRLRSIWEI